MTVQKFSVVLVDGAIYDGAPAIAFIVRLVDGAILFALFCSGDIIGSVDGTNGDGISVNIFIVDASATRFIVGLVDGAILFVLFVSGYIIALVDGANGGGTSMEDCTESTGSIVGPFDSTSTEGVGMKEGSAFLSETCNVGVSLMILRRG